MNLLAAAVMEGEADLADIMFLVALIVAIVSAVLYAMARNIAATLAVVALAAVAFGLLAL